MLALLAPGDFVETRTYTDAAARYALSLFIRA